jgi:hypothetical protein
MVVLVRPSALATPSGWPVGHLALKYFASGWWTCPIRATPSGWPVGHLALKYFASGWWTCPIRATPSGWPVGHLALKYFASGWWTTIAEVDCSGWSMNSSVSSTPMADGSTSSNSCSCISRSGQAAYPKE